MEQPLLSQVKEPQNLKNMSLEQLQDLADELRQEIIRVVSCNGGHLASNLGVIELTLALHSVFSSPRDKIIWDVGHQCYAHKLITGRKEEFPTIRRYGGLAGFPKREESIHDPFNTGHSSTSISAALGMALARDLQGEDFFVVAVIGDGSLTGGMAFEALNHAGNAGSKLIVVLNDNEMSISPNVGALSSYLNRLRTDPTYQKVKEDVEYILSHIPAIGKTLVRTVERAKDSLKYFLVPGMLFEELGFTYLGPIDGHNLGSLQMVLQNAKQIDGPVLIHVITQKGKGYLHAEKAPNKFHGIGPFEVISGKKSQLETIPSYSQIFGQELVKIAEKDRRVVAISAAMIEGTGLEEFALRFPDRIFDVGIAEQHAVTLAAGMAAQGLRPVVAIYSTFLQRAYDQILHDVCLQNLPVIFALDRAGLVGEDGPTHHGVFDFAYLRHIPNMTVMAPANELELREMLQSALNYAAPVAIRFPRGKGLGITADSLTNPISYGKGVQVRQGRDVAFLAAGTMVKTAEETAELLFKKGVRASVANVRFIKPLDRELILSLAHEAPLLVTLEEHVLSCGFGSAVSELLADEGLEHPVLRFGLPDQFVPHGEREMLLKECELLPPQIAEKILHVLKPYQHRKVLK